VTELISSRVKIETEQQEDGTWQGRVYWKTGRAWHAAGVTSKYPTKAACAAAVIALSAATKPKPETKVKP
jgi:hypothetical protein